MTGALLRANVKYLQPMTEPRQPDVLSRLPIPEEVRDDVMEMLRVGPSAVWGRPVLNRRERSLATIAMMTALGNEFAIREHIIMGLDSFGLSREEILEVMIQAAIYAGFPAAMKAFEIATEIFAERDSTD